MQMWSLTSMDFTGITVEISHLPARGQLHAAVHVAACYYSVSKWLRNNLYYTLCGYLQWYFSYRSIYYVTVICHIRFLFE